MKMASDLEQKIIHQLEYYFGDINLNRDKFLKEKIKEDEQGWVTLEVLLTFKRLAGLSTDQEVIVAAIEKSENKLVEVSEDRKKLRRNPENPVPEFNDEKRKEIMERTAYAKGFPLDEELNDIIAFLEPHGPIESCNRRSTKDHKFKGSCFIIFKDVDTCKKFVEAESIQYKETELIRKFQKVYFDDKKKEAEERKQAKKAKQGNTEDKPQQKQLEFPKGAIIHFSGLEEGQNISREEIKDKIKEVCEIEPAYMDFNKGDLEGYVRFPEENDAVKFLEKVPETELVIDKIKMKLRLLEGEEEQEYHKKSSDAIIEMRKRQKTNGRNNRKRKGNFGGYQGKESKSRKKN